MDNGYHPPEKDFTPPKELTNFLPRTNAQDIMGREEDIVQLRTLLEKEKRVVLISGLSGVGKTTLAEAYISDYYKEYEHVAWITRTCANIADDFVLTFGLARCLDIPITNAGFKELFRSIIYKMENLEGDNLLVIDDAGHDASPYHDLLQHLPHWHLLLISKQPIEGFNSPLNRWLPDTRNGTEADAKQSTGYVRQRS